MNFLPKKDSDTLLASISKRSAAVLEKRFGLGKSGKRQTLESIGIAYGITRERVRQIERDGINRIQKSTEYKNLQPLFLRFRQYIRDLGGIVKEEQFITHFNTDGASANAARFLLTLAPQLIYRGETDSFCARWGGDTTNMNQIEQSLDRVAEDIRTQNHTISYAELSSLLNHELSRTSIVAPGDSILASYLAISKHIGKNYFDAWGHTSSPLIRPRGVRDLAYLIFQKEGRPMHFANASERIRTVAAPRRVHNQTVHNELIKDSRFVLVGRGTYGLVEWGYEPGTVCDIISRILASKPKNREDIIKEVLNKRQVKENTILINLQNRKYFKKFPDGTYGTIV
jgi:hypothetical protein